MKWSNDTIVASLRHEPQLRVLARALLADPSDRDDAVAETIERVARHPPRSLGALPTYLATVFRNLVREKARTAERRRRREAAAEPIAALPSPEDALERESVRRVVLDAVAALDEPYRSTVIWIFLEDLPPHVLAAKLGVNASTIRTRVHRGLEKLRARLEGRFGINGRDWRTAVSPLALPIAGPAPFLALLEGTFVMKKTVVAALVLVATVATLVLFESGGDDASFRGGSHDAVAPSAITADDSLELRAVDAPSSAREVVGSTPIAPTSDAPLSTASAFGSPEFSGGYRGRLARADGAPAADGRVVVLEFDSRLSPTTIARIDDAAMRRLEVACAADGSFEVRGLRVLARHLLIFHAAGASVARTSEREPGPGEVVDLGVVALDSRGSVRGRVVDSRGEPVAGARVLALSPAIEGEGLAQILWGVRYDHFARETKLAVQRDDASAFDVVDVPAAIVRLVESLALPVAESRADGSFELFGLDAKGSTLIATRIGMRSAVATRIDGTRASEVGDLVLEAGATTLVRVVDSANRPVAGAEVYSGPLSHGERSFHAILPKGVTGADGACSLTGLMDAPLIFAVRRSPRDPFVTLVARAPAVEIPIVLPELCAFELAVTCPGRAAPESLVVEAIQGRPSGEVLALRLAHSRIVDAVPLGRGAFRCDGLDAGDWLMRVVAQGAAPAFVAVSIPCAKPIEVSLERGFTLDAAIVARDGQPVVGAEIELRSAEGWALQRTLVPGTLGIPHADMLPLERATSDSGGRFRIDSLAAGKYRLTLRHPAHSDHDAAIELPCEAQRFVLAPPSLLEGLVLVEGQGVSEKRRLRVESSVRYDRSPEVVVFFDSDDTGKFAFRGIGPGEYALSSEVAAAVPPLTAIDAMLSRRVARRSTTRFMLAEGGKLFVYHEENPFLAAPDEASLSVVGVVTLDGEPLEGAIVTVVSQEEFVSRRPEGLVATTDATGRFRIDRVVAPRDAERGIAIACHDASGSLGCYRNSNRAAPPEVRADFAFVTARLHGRVRAPDGTPRACKVNVMGEIDGGGSKSELVETDDAGRFEFPRLLCGVYDVQTFSKAGNSTLRALRVHAGDNEVDLVMYGMNDIGGKVNLPSLGAGPNSAITAVLLMDPPLMNYWPRSIVGEDGSFRFEGVFPETYDVCFVVEGKWFRGAEKVTVKADAIEGLLIEPIPCDPPDYPMPSFPKTKSDVPPPPSADDGAN